MNELLSFANLISYFGDIDTATNFCVYVGQHTKANLLPDAINACSNVWNTFNNNY